nr:hypothetical protein GCM10025730_55130 [Promicromonospora thailandica]
MQVRQPHHGRRLRREHLGGELGELLPRRVPDQLGQDRGEVRLQRRQARHAASTRGEALRDEPGDLLVGAVLQEPREQQVAGLEQLQVLGVLVHDARQQARGLEVEQGRRNHQELAGHAQVPRLVDLAARRGLARRALGLADVRHELVRHDRERHLGDVHLVLRDEREQQVERALEVVQPHLERAGRPALLGGILGPHPLRRLRLRQDRLLPEAAALRRAGASFLGPHPLRRLRLRQRRHGPRAPGRADGTRRPPGAPARTP